MKNNKNKKISKNKKDAIVINGEWYEEIEYVLHAVCPECDYRFDEFKVGHYDGESFTKTLNCPDCNTKVKIKTKGI